MCSMFRAINVGGCSTEECAQDWYSVRDLNDDDKFFGRLLIRV